MFMRKLLLFSVFVLCYTLSVFAQSHSIMGTVVDSSTLEPISGINIIIRHRTDNSIIAYTTTTDNGDLFITHFL